MQKSSFPKVELATQHVTGLLPKLLLLNVGVHKIYIISDSIYIYFILSLRQYIKKFVFLVTNRYLANKKP